MSSNVAPPVGRVPRPAPDRAVPAAEEGLEEVAELAGIARRVEFVANVAALTAETGEAGERVAGRTRPRTRSGAGGARARGTPPVLAEAVVECRFSGSDKTALASFTALNRCSASASPLFWSGVVLARRLPERLLDVPL